MSAAAAPGSSPVGRHVGALVSRDAVNRITRFAAAVLLARALTLEEYGILNTGIAAAGITVTAASLGLNDLGARQVAASPHDLLGRSRLAGQVLVARLTLLAALTLLALVVTALLSPGSLPVVILVCAIALTMASAADWILRGLERMRELGDEIAAGGVAVLAGAVALTIGTGSAASGLMVILGGELVSAYLTWRWAGTVPRFQTSRAQLRSLLVRSWPLALSSIAMYTYYANLDTILLAALRSPEEAGLYSAPYRVFLALNAISIYTAFSFLPMLTRGVESGTEAETFEALRRGARYLLAYGGVLLAGAILVGGAGLGLLFGPGFEEMGPTFVVLCIAIMWFSVGYPVGYALIAKQQNHRFLAGSATGAILNLALNLVLIPEFGPIGAAAATAGAFAAACLVWLWGNGILGRESAIEIGGMAAISAAGILGLVEPGLRVPAVAFIVVTCSLLLYGLVRTRRKPDGG